MSETQTVETRSGGFEGWFIKFGSQKLPMKYLNKGGYSSTPNQRQEASAWQDTGGHLHRDTASHYRTKIEFKTVDGITLAEKQEIQSIMNSAITDKKERKGSITYWNEEENAYKQATVYIPDITFEVDEVDEKRKTVYYNSIRIALIEY